MKTLAILAKDGSGVENAIQNRYQPVSENVLLPPNAVPRYIDDAGDRWHYIEIESHPELVDALHGISNSPQIHVYEVAEQVHVDDIDGRQTRWIAGDLASVWLMDRGEILEGLVTMISVNDGTQAQLETLSGVGPSLAQKIIDDRPYDTVDELARVSGVSEGMVDGWREEITV